MSDLLQIGDDGIPRCWWPGAADDYVQYHDHEWGRPVVNDTRLFEKICLEGFQSGLSWITILRKRENFRAAFADFDIATVAAFDDDDIERLVLDAGIIRHRGKIRSTINNANRALEMIDESGSLARFFWGYEPPERDRKNGDVDDSFSVPAITATSTRIAKDLKKRGWSFVGPTTVYAFMQAMGLVNDHAPGCEAGLECAAERDALIRPS